MKIVSDKIILNFVEQVKNRVADAIILHRLLKQLS